MQIVRGFFCAKPNAIRKIYGNPGYYKKKTWGGLVSTLPRTPPDWDKFQPHILEWVKLDGLGLEWNVLVWNDSTLHSALCTWLAGFGMECFHFGLEEETPNVTGMNGVGCGR